MGGTCHNEELAANGTRGPGLLSGDGFLHLIPGSRPVLEKSNFRAVFPDDRPEGSASAKHSPQRERERSYLIRLPIPQTLDPLYCYHNFMRKVLAAPCTDKGHMNSERFGIRKAAQPSGRGTRMETRQSEKSRHALCRVLWTLNSQKGKGQTLPGI